MYILLWIVFGGVIGWLASIITKNDSQMGIVWNIVVGLVGSSIGGIIAQFAGIAPLSIFSFWGAFFAFIGSIVLLSLFNFIRRNRHN